jgi:hypothetical protein
MTRWLDQD